MLVSLNESKWVAWRRLPVGPDNVFGAHGRWESVPEGTPEAMQVFLMERTIDGKRVWITIPDREEER